MNVHSFLTRKGCQSLLGFGKQSLLGSGTRSISQLVDGHFSVSAQKHAGRLSIIIHPKHLQGQQHLSQQSRSIFIQSEDTPNPESVKFIPTGIVVLPDGDFNGYYVTKTGMKKMTVETYCTLLLTLIWLANALSSSPDLKDHVESILRSPLANDLFKIDGIKAVYLGSNFVTITKFASKKWRELRPQILDVLMTFFDGDTPALNDQPAIIDTTILDDDDEVVAMIKELIESRIRPAVQEDGGDIRYVGFAEESGIVTVELAGSCVGCPSSSVTLKQGGEWLMNAGCV